MDIKELYLNGELTAIGDDAEFEKKHPRKGGKFVKKGDGEAKKSILDQISELVAKKTGVSVEECKKVIANGIKNGNIYNYEDAIIAVKHTKKEDVDYSKMSDVDLGKAHADAINNKNAILAAKIEKEKNARFTKECAEMTDEELAKSISDNEALVKRYGKKDNPYATKLKIAEAEMDKRVEAEAQKKKGVDNSKMSDSGVRGLIEDGIAKANKGKSGLVVSGDCRVTVYSTSKGDCVSIAYLRDPNESVDDTNAAIKSQYDRVAAFLKKNGFELQGDAHKFDKKYLDGFGDRPIELFSLGWVKKVEK